MKVLLIDPAGWQKHSINLGLAYLAGSLHKENIEIKILDLNNKHYPPLHIERIITKYAPHIIGVSVKTATANSVKILLTFLKERFPKTIIVVGGPHISICGEQFLSEERSIDFGFFYESETSFTEFCKNINNGDVKGKEIKNTIYYKDGKLIINRLLPGNDDLSQYALPYFESIIGFDCNDFRYPLLTSRGCPYGCICCVGIISGKHWRSRSPEHVVGELIEAKKKYRITSFEIMDDNFTFDIDRAKKICRLLIKEKLGFDWWCHNGIRADRLDRELVLLMKKAGCKSIAIGIETADEELFNSINKKEKLSDIINAVNLIKGSGIKCVGYFIVGLPGDSIEKTRRTVRFQRNLKLADYKYNMFVPYPGTKAWDIIKENGKILIDITNTAHFGDYSKVSFETAKLNSRAIEQCNLLANQQGWISGEEDLNFIRQTFGSRFGRNAKSIFCITDNNSSWISKFIEIEFNDAIAIEASLDRFNICQGNYNLSARDSSYNYFESLFGLSQKGYKFCIDCSQGKIFALKNFREIEEYVVDEILAHPKNWDNPQGKLFVTKLKFLSPAIQSARNGIVYKDGLPLSFSPTPEWEKIPCGKIESGLAFISLTAYKLDSKYTASYLALKIDYELEEMIDGIAIKYQDKNYNPSLLERIMSEADILFVPEYLSGFALIFSRAKMNVVYYNQKQGEISLRYEILENSRFYYKIFRNLKSKSIFRLKGLKFKVKDSLIKIKKVYKVFLIWGEILARFIYENTIAKSF